QVGRLRDHPDLPVVRRYDDAVELVEVEVATAGEVAEDLSAARAWWKREDGLDAECRRVEPEEPRPVDADADGHDAARRVEGERRAFRAEERRDLQGRATERAGTGVRVGLVRVVVDVAPPVRSHERVLWYGRAANGSRGGGSAEVRRHVRVRILRDRDGDGRGREEKEREQRAHRHMAVPFRERSACSSGTQSRGRVNYAATGGGETGGIRVISSRAARTPGGSCSRSRPAARRTGGGSAGPRPSTRRPRARSLRPTGVRTDGRATAGAL